MPEVDYVIVTAGSFDLMIEVVCESDDHLLELLSKRVRALPGVREHGVVRLPQVAQADVFMGRSLTYRGLSLWHETCGDDLVPRSSLPGDTDVDVAIVGAGFTGLWTAYYLTELDPSLRIAVLEAEIAGFGASGRNGGWMSALFPSSRDHLAALPGSSREAATRHTVAMRDAIDEAAA